MCPGDSLNVPWTVANRTNSAGTERAHSMGFYLTDGTNRPFDPTSEFLQDVPLSGAILNNEIEIDSTGQLNMTGVQTLTLSNDPDCAPAGDYRLWHGVDICHEYLEGNGTVAAGGAFEDDNFALTRIGQRHSGQRRHLPAVRDPQDLRSVTDAAARWRTATARGLRGGRRGLCLRRCGRGAG